MKTSIRRKIDMLNRVLEFIQANPTDDAGYNAVAARLQDQGTRVAALSLQQRDGSVGQHASITQRDTLRSQMHRELVHLSRVAAVAAHDNPGLVEAIPAPDHRGPLHDFITAAKSMLAMATTNKDVLIALGLGTTFIDQLTQQIAQFDNAAEAANAGRRNHVGAQAELEAIGNDCMELVRLMDGASRARFQASPDLLAAWESARNLAWPVRKRAATKPPAAGTPPVVDTPAAPASSKEVA